MMNIHDKSVQPTYTQVSQHLRRHHSLSHRGRSHLQSSGVSILGFETHRKTIEEHTGAMTDDLILYFAPSRARVLVNATRLILAAL